MNHIRLVLLTLTIILLISSCGQKGPLYLPSPEKDPAMQNK